LGILDITDDESSRDWTSETISFFADGDQADFERANSEASSLFREEPFFHEGGINVTKETTGIGFSEDAVLHKSANATSVLINQFIVQMYAYAAVHSGPLPLQRGPEYAAEHL